MTDTKKFTKTKIMAEGAILVALATVLSLFSFGGFWVNGGSITIASMVPIVVFAFRHNIKWSLAVAFIFGGVQLIIGFGQIRALDLSFFVAALVLDYLVAFTVLGLAGIFKKRFKNQSISVITGVSFVVILRFIAHLISGILIWEQLWPNELGMSSFVFSFVYNGSYMLPELLITVLVSLVLVKAMDRILPQ